MKNKFKEFFKHRQRKQYLRVSTPDSHYFKSKKHKRCQEPSVGSCRCWLCKSCKVFLSRHPDPHPSRVKFNWFHIRVSRYAFLFLFIRIFGSIWKYRMQWFSWRTCTVRAAGAHVEFRRHELLGASGVMPPWEICKIGLPKLQFAALPGPELGNQNYDRNHLFFFFSIVCIT